MNLYSIYGSCGFLSGTNCNDRCGAQLSLDVAYLIYFLSFSVFSHVSFFFCVWFEGISLPDLNVPVVVVFPMH